jgi:hypothetical protein
MTDMRRHMNSVEKTRIYMAPADTPEFVPHSIFLAGSIDMGEAENWQERVTAALLTEFPRGLAIFNPRRDDWDSSWVQDISDPQFSEQVRWELAHLEKADTVCVYFDPNGKAPITLLELGLHAASGKVVVCCPDGYWRRGNVQIVCDKYDIPLFDDIDDLIEALKERVA